MKVIALLTCIIFVIILLIFDRKLSRVYTLSSWIPTLWLIYCATRPINQWFAPPQFIESSNIADGSATDRTILAVLIAIGCIILLSRKIDWPLIIRNHKAILLLFLYMLISILWSDYMYVSVKRWVKTSGIIIMSLVILTGPDPLEETKSVLRRIIYMLIPFSILLIKYFPFIGVTYGRWSGEPSWNGVTVGKNGLGVLCMISGLFIIWSTYCNKSTETNFLLKPFLNFFNLILLSITFILIKGPGGSFSATSTICLILGFLLLFVINKINSSIIMKRFAIKAAFLSFCLFLFFRLIDFNPVYFIADLVGRDHDLTGRDGIWEMLMPYALRQPIFGLGFGGFWLEPIRLDAKLTINQAHNGYLDVFIQVGTIGLILLFTFLLSSFNNAIKLFDIRREWGIFFFTILIISLFHNFTESSFLMSTIFIWNLTVFLSITIKPMYTIENNIQI